MALSLRAASGGQNGATTVSGQTITLPTGTAARDIVYFVVSVGAVVSAPTCAGWTLTLTTNPTNTQSTIVGYRTIQSGDGNPTCSWTGAGKTAWAAIAVAPGVGLLAVHSLWATPENLGTAATTYHVPGLTAATTGAASVVLNGFKRNVDSATGVTATATSGWTEPANADQTTAVGTTSTTRQVAAEISGRVALSTGAVNPGTGTLTASAFSITHHALVTESAGTNYTQTITDAIGAVDTPTRVAASIRAQTDAIGAADSSVLFTDAPQSYTRTITDTIGAADSTVLVTPLGGVTDTGRLYVACEHKAGVPTTAYVRSATVYAWSGSSLLCEVVQMPAVAGVDTAFAQMWMMDPSPADTVDRLGFQYRAAAGALDCIGQTGAGFTDVGTTTTLTYSAATHRWLRISHTGSSIVWATSPDGLTWTTRRALGTPPSWTTKPTLKVSFEAYRTTGTNDRLLIDSVNLPPLRIVRPVLGLSAVGRSYSF